MSDVTRSGCHICHKPPMPEKVPYTVEEAARFCPGALAHAEERLVALSETLDRTVLARNEARVKLELLRDQLEQLRGRLEAAHNVVVTVVSQMDEGQWPPPPPPFSVTEHWVEVRLPYHLTRWRLWVSAGGEVPVTDHDGG